MPASAIAFRLTRTGYVAALDELRYADTTGAYNEAANPGGYGAPNTERAERAYFLAAERMASDGTVSARLLGEAAAPLTAAAFVLKPGRDGYYRVRLLAFPVAAVVPTPESGEAGDVAYITSESRVYLLTADGWVASTAELHQNDPRFVLADVDEALSPAAQRLRDQLVDRVAGLGFDGASDAFQSPGDQQLLRLNTAVRSLLGAADICWQRGQPFLFQLRVERLFSLATEAARLLS